MSDEQADKYVTVYAEALGIAANDTARLRTLRLLVKDIERDTRHRAFDAVQECANKIINLDHGT